MSLNLRRYDGRGHYGPGDYMQYYQYHLLEYYIILQYYCNCDVPMTHFSARASAGQPGPWPGSGQT